MRAWLLVLALLLLLPLLDAQSKGKGKSKGGKNKNSNREEDGDSQDDNRHLDDEDYDDEETPEGMGEGDEKVIPLPRNTMLMEDADVEMSSMHRMFSGDAGCQVSCKGSVSGMTKNDPRYPYYRYIHVDISSCYDENTVFSPDIIKMEMDNDGQRQFEFSHWNASVTKLHYYKIKDDKVHQIPKRLSRPTEVQSSHMHCLRDEEECQPTQRSFGFVVFIPRYDMQVKWRVDWEVNARNPYVNMDEENAGNWNYGNCEDVVDEYMNDRRYQSNAFSIDRDDGYSFWSPVGQHDRNEYDERQ